jgi:O-antigen/teichoic acid export membrane protein
MVARFGVLAQLVAAGFALSNEEYQVLAVALSLSAAAQVLLDSGAVSYLSVVQADARAFRQIFWQVFRVQLLVTTLGLAATALLLLRSARHLEGIEIVFAASVILAAGAEVVARMCRVTWLRNKLQTRYALVDGIFGAVRIGSAIALLLTGSAVWIFLGSLVAVAVAIVILSLSRPRAARFAPDESRLRQPFGVTFRQCLNYALPMTAAGLYSQVPTLIVTAIAPLSVAASLAIATRISQPLEIVAASYTQFALPSLTSDARARFSIRTRLLKLGAIIAPLGAIGGGLYLAFTAEGLATWLCLLILLMSLPLKYANYGSAAIITALRRPLVRLKVSLAVGLFAVAFAAVAVHFGVYWVAAGMALCEILLFLSFRSAIRRLETSQE